MSTDQRELSISSLVNVLPSQGFRDEQAARYQPPCMPKRLCAYLLTPGQRRHAANAFGLVCSFFSEELCTVVRQGESHTSSEFIASIDSSSFKKHYSPLKCTYTLLKQFSDGIFSNISQAHSIKLEISLNIWSFHSSGNSLSDSRLWLSLSDFLMDS